MIWGIWSCLDSPKKGQNYITRSGEYGPVWNGQSSVGASLSRHMCWSSTRFLGQFSALLTFLLSPLRREVDLKVLGPLCFRIASVNLDQSFSHLRRASVNLSQSFNRLRRALVNLNHLSERSINQSVPTKLFSNILLEDERFVFY